MEYLSILFDSDWKKGQLILHQVAENYLMKP